MWRDRELERQRDRETERQRDRERASISGYLVVYKREGHKLNQSRALQPARSWALYIIVFVKKEFSFFILIPFNAKNALSHRERNPRHGQKMQCSSVNVSSRSSERCRFARFRKRRQCASHAHHGSHLDPANELSQIDRSLAESHEHVMSNQKIYFTGTIAPSCCAPSASLSPVWQQACSP